MDRERIELSTVCLQSSPGPQRPDPKMFFVGPAGIDPASVAYKATALPLS